MSRESLATERSYLTQARQYLLSFEGVTTQIIDAHLHDWKQRKPKDIPGLFQAMLLHAQNRQGMPNTIGSISRLKKLLFGFNPGKVIAHYSTWDDLFDAISEAAHVPASRFDKGNAKSYWVIYCKSIMSCADFLSRYSSMQQFDEFVDGFMTNEFSRLALPLLLKEEVFGFGFALSCDFLKETGYPQFLKPDTHINDIARGLGISHSSTDFGVFKDVEAYCNRIKKLPYEVDKLFWLVGSGRFYLSELKVNSSKHDFISSFGRR